MKTLILLRHAKSSWDFPDLSDQDRPLNNRGKKDAPLIAEVLKKKNIKMDLIISSTSKRTMETAKVFANTLNLKIIEDRNLYLASEPEIIRIVKKIDDCYDSVILVGHNPGMTNLINLVSNTGIDNLPTTGIIGIPVKNTWNNFGSEKCEILFFEFPKKIKQDRIN
ncbi:MAG: histidine phosphatase family protein [Ignavibacteriaceae bacterium]